MRDFPCQPLSSPTGMCKVLGTALLWCVQQLGAFMSDNFWPFPWQIRGCNPVSLAGGRCLTELMDQQLPGGNSHCSINCTLTFAVPSSSADEETSLGRGRGSQANYWCLSEGKEKELHGWPRLPQRWSRALVSSTELIRAQERQPEKLQE